jgi:predicted transporter
LIIMNDLQKVDMLPCPVCLAIIASCVMSIESMMTHAGKEHYSSLFSDV